MDHKNRANHQTRSLSHRERGELWPQVLWSLSLPPSLSVSVYPPICLSISTSTFIYPSTSSNLSFQLTLLPSSLTFSPYLYLSHIYLSLFIYSFLYITISSFLCLPSFLPLPSPSTLTHHDLPSSLPTVPPSPSLPLLVGSTLGRSKDHLLSRRERSFLIQATGGGGEKGEGGEG